jgi:hypothetical protein
MTTGNDIGQLAPRHWQKAPRQMAPRRWPLAARSWHIAPSPRQIAARLWQPAFLVALALWMTPAAADPAVPVDVRVGNHPGFGRLVVEFDVRMAYHESREGDHLTLRFDNDVDFTPPAYPPHNIGAVSVGHNLLDLTLHAGVTTHVSWFGDRLVVDVFDPVDTATGEVPLAVLASGGLPGTASPTDASEADASPIGVAPLRAAWHRGGRPLPLPPPPAPPPPIAPGTEASAPASQSVAPAPPYHRSRQHQRCRRPRCCRPQRRWPQRRRP